MALRKVKGFQIQVELQIQTVNCPGVWLCPNGNVSLQISMLDSCTQTSTVGPLFPLLFQEKFVFYKTFVGVNKLTTLQKRLSKECMYVELIQWKRYEDIGNVLAFFETSVADLLYPGNSYIDYCDIDLLMEPMKNFPGILAPKIEVSTKTIIEDKLLYDKSLVPPTDGDYHNSYTTDSEAAFVLHPKPMKTSKANRLSHHKRVCHSATYKKSQQHELTTCCNACNHENIKKPPFVYRKVQEDLICRKPEFHQPKPRSKCNHTSGSKSGNKNSKNENTACANADRTCCDSTGFSRKTCGVCSKYKSYFDDTTSIKSKKCDKMRSSLPSCIVEYPTASIKTCRCDNIIEKRSPTLAETMHRRLKETLDVCPQPALIEYFSAAHDRYCDCLSSRQGSSCTPPPCAGSIGNFCKNLYGKSKSAYNSCLET